MTNADIQAMNKRFKNTRLEGDKKGGSCFLHNTLIATWTSHSLTIQPLKRIHWTKTTLVRINQLLECCSIKSRLHQYTSPRGETSLYFSDRKNDRWLESSPAFFSFSGEVPIDIQVKPRYYIHARLNTDTAKELVK